VTSAEGGVGVNAVLNDGPLGGVTIEVRRVEGRPPSTIDVPDDDDATMYRYCLADWAQDGPSAQYTFLYSV
jgi:hypothetical protein